MSKGYLCGIGWVTGAGTGWGSAGGEFRFGELPLPALSRQDVFPQPNQRFGRMSDYAKLGIAALAFALRDAGLESWSVKRNIGVVAATRLGCLATDLDYHRTILLEGGELASPNLFAYTLANCFLGDAAIQFGLTGSLLAVNESRGGLDALALALEELALGETEAMLAGICDLPAPPELEGTSDLLAGSVFLVVSSAPPSGPRCYGAVSLSGEGGVLWDGAPAESLLELVQRALR